MADDSEIVEIVDDDVPYEEKVSLAHVMAHPMASEKLARRLFKLVRKAKRLRKVDNATKSLVKSIAKKGQKGIVILAGDTSPIDIISHIPIVCEENGVPYCYVPSKADLGRSTSSSAVAAAFITEDDQYEALYNKCYESVDNLPIPIN